MWSARDVAPCLVLPLALPHSDQADEAGHSDSKRFAGQKYVLNPDWRALVAPVA